MTETRKPGKGRLLIKLEHIEPQTSSGLFIAPAYSNIKYGTILAVGECSFPIEVDSMVCMMTGSGIEIGDGELILHEGEILYTY